MQEGVKAKYRVGDSVWVYDSDTMAEPEPGIIVGAFKSGHGGVFYLFNPEPMSVDLGGMIRVEHSVERATDDDLFADRESAYIAWVNDLANSRELITATHLSAQSKLESIEREAADA